MDIVQLLTDDITCLRALGYPSMAKHLELAIGTITAMRDEGAKVVAIPQIDLRDPRQLSTLLSRKGEGG